MQIFSDLFGVNEKFSYGSIDTNKDFCPFQRDCQFLIFEKKLF